MKTIFENNGGSYTQHRATEIVKEQVIYKWEKGTTYGEKFRRLCLNFVCQVAMHNLSEQTICG